MKRVIRILGLACMTGLLAVATSCKKENTNTTEIDVVIPGMSTADQGERAYINEGWTFSWQPSDQIMVYNLDEPEGDGTTASVCGVYHTNNHGARAKFSGPSLGRKLDLDYRYFYPVNMVQPDDTSAAANMIALGMENRQNFYVPNIQHYNFFEAPGHPKSRVDVSSMPLAISTNNLKAAATLKHMFGVAVVQLEAAEGETIVVNTVKIIDNVFNLWGQCSVKLHPVNMSTLTDLIDTYMANAAVSNMSQYEGDFASYVIGELGWTSQAGVLPNYSTTDNEEKRTMILDCIHTDPETQEQVGVTLSTTPPSEFCFMLRPLALSHGFNIVVEFANRAPLTITEWSDDLPRKVSSRCMYPGTYRTFRYQTPITQ